MTKTAAQTKAQYVYIRKFKRPCVRLLPDEYDMVTDAAKAAGESLNEFMYNAIMQRIKREGQA